MAAIQDLNISRMFLFIVPKTIPKTPNMIPPIIIPMPLIKHNAKDTIYNRIYNVVPEERKEKIDAFIPRSSKNLSLGG